MQEQVFFNKTLRNISKLSTHLIPHKALRHKLRDKIFLNMNARYNRLFFNTFREANKNFLMHTNLAVSLGDACQAAYYLQQYHLRLFSSPFDWMKCYSLKDVQALFESDFKTFFIDIYEREDINVGNGCRYVVDRKNGMVSMHAFNQDKSLQEQHENMLKIMNKRFNNLKKHIKQSDSILFLTTRKSDIESFKEFLFFMQDYHRAKYTILNIAHTPSDSHIFSKPTRENINLSDNLRLVEYRFNNIYPNNDILFNSANTGGGGGGRAA